MDSWVVLFLGVIALSSLVQAVFLIGLAVGGRRLARRLDEMQKGVRREIRPSLDNLSRITRNLAEIADFATLQARRVDDVLADTVGKNQEATDMVRRVVLRPLCPRV